MTTESINQSIFTDADLPPVRKIDRPDTYNLFFRKLHGLPDGWQFVRLDASPDKCPEGFAHVDGGLLSAKGKWRGRDKSGDRSFFFRLEDLHKFERELADAMGVCVRCWGEGRERVRISVTPGDNTFRVCRGCGGTGKGVGL